MNLTYVKYLIAIKKYGSITKASKYLFMSQPNMSKAIKNLENSLNIQILNRDNNGCNFTKEGKEFIEKVEPLIKDLENIYLKYINEKNDDEVILSALPSSLFESIVFTEMLEKKFKINFQQLSFIEVMETVQNQKRAYGFLYYPISSKEYFSQIIENYGLKTHYIDRDNMYIITSNKNNTIEKIDFDDKLENTTYIFYENLFEDKDAYIELPLLKRFLSRSDSQIFRVSDRLSEYNALQIIPNTISLSVRQPFKTLDNYNLKLIPIKDEEAEFIIVYKDKNVDEKILYILDKFKEALHI